ncbi:Nucleotide-binding oligomerization domain-containing protein 2 [Holothuria leucospilota]|uniref:Nucleotide-binding oligomerization domain-containing protein 2 n=1 Tax=Holothuria leucospilota TaxID=206669 RepID=A0A9Q1HGT1_HOLLE|nr:Nucleotide-binding oligomerization domain-containing protein 2 [Holothuria leucospilota]
MAFEFETKHGIVDEETLLILSKKLTHEWRDVGKHLTLSDLDLDELESNKNYGMLRKWKQLQSKDATYSKLTDVLEKVNRQDLVTLVNEEIEKRSAGHPTKLHEAPSEPVAKKLKLMKASETESEENITNIQAKYVGEVGSTFTDAPTSFTSPIPIEESLQLFVQELKQTYQSMIRAFRPVPHLNASVNEIFVDTRLEELEENAHYWENRWSLSSYCRDAVLKKDAQRLLLIGNHGFGKSTLCLQVAYEWVTAVKSSPTSEIDILLFIRLQEVPDVKSIYRMIKLLLLPKGCKLKDETIEEILRLPQLRVVLLLDGLDKFSKISNKCDIYSIISGNLFPKAKVVITTSPDHINSSLLGEHIKMMRMTEFDESVQYRYIIKAAAPSKSEHEECETLIRVFKENYLLGGLCNVPLFFTMFFHLLKGNPELAKQKSITVFYDCMRKCFFNRVKNVKIAQMKGSSNVTEDSYLCLRLGKIAFDDFDEMSPNLSWSKKHLVEKLGRNGYETYTTSGILVQDKVFYESIDDAQHFNEEPELRVRFFDKTMQEYYAAHYLVQRIKDNHAKDNAKVISEYLKKLNPSNLKYFYLFACGLDDTVAKALIKFLLHNYGQDPPVLLIMEIEDANKVKEFFGTIFECSVTINTTHDSKHLQRAKAFFVTTASKFKIQIPSIELHDLFGSLNVTTGNFESKDGLNLPSLCYVKRLLLKDEGRVWTEEEFNGVLEYAAGCDGLEILEFSHCMVPFDVSEEADIPKISCKKLYVQWITVNTSFVLHLRPFKWLVPNYLLSGNAVLWELWKLEKGGPPFNNFRVLDQLRYENIDRDFYIKYSH